MCALLPLHVCVDPVVYEREHNSKTNKNHDGGRGWGGGGTHVRIQDLQVK